MAKPAIQVDRPKLEDAINKAEAKGPLKNRSVLHAAAADIYNKSKPPAKISPAVVGLRIAAWNIEVATPMGRIVGGKSKQQEPIDEQEPTKAPETNADKTLLVSVKAHVPEEKITPQQRAEEILAKGKERATLMLQQAKRHGYWKHVDWNLVEEKLGLKVVKR